MKANAPEWWLIGLGLIGSLFLGAMNPLFAVFFGEIIEVFARPASEVLDGLHLWAGLFLALGFAAGAGTFLKVRDIIIPLLLLFLPLFSLSFSSHFVLQLLVRI